MPRKPRRGKRKGKSKSKHLQREVSQLQKKMPPVNLGLYSVVASSGAVATTYTSGAKILCNVAQGATLNARSRDEVKLKYTDINWHFTNGDSNTHRFCRMIILWSETMVAGTESKAYSTSLVASGTDNIHSPLNISAGCCVNSVARKLGLRGAYHIMYDSGPMELQPIAAAGVTLSGTNDATHNICAFGSGTPSRKTIHKRIYWRDHRQFFSGASAGTYDFGTPVMITIQDSANVSEQGAYVTYFES